ncbi:MAG: HEAT repeat domain-containing protein, partial [Planctomycetes bacterium]|nr:HEAT repeat domain-containing protein [Planctomycetota bacterium]
GSFPTENVLPPAPIRDSDGSSSSSGEPENAATEELLDGAGSAGSLAPAYQPARSRLFRPYDEWTLAETAADALGRIGAASTEEVTAMLDDADPVIRRRGAEILARIGPDAETAVEPLLRVAEQDPDPAVRKAAIYALGQIGPNAAAAVPALMQILRDSPNSP